MRVKARLPIRAFKSSLEWRNWLARNHTRSSGVWLRFFKKASGVTTITYAEALDEALCYGWIDGQGKKGDARSWLQKYTPRRAGSVWSKKNTLHAARLVKAGKMMPSGLDRIKAAKSDGRWDRAYDSPSSMRIPKDFLEELSKDKKAKAFFETLNKANLYAIAWRLQTAKKPETRARRMQALLAKMAKEERLH